MVKETYQPSKEEINKAEEMMTDEQKEMSEQREKECVANHLENISERINKASYWLKTISHQSGTNPEAEKEYYKEFIDSVKPIEEMFEQKKKGLQTQFNQEIQKAISDGRLGLLLSEYSNIIGASSDAYMIRYRPLNESLNTFHQNSELLMKLLKAIKETDLSKLKDNEMFVESGVEGIKRESRSTWWDGKDIIKRIETEKSNLTDKEKKKTISEINRILEELENIGVRGDR